MAASTSLPPEIVEAVARALAQAVVRAIRDEDAAVADPAGGKACRNGDGGSTGAKGSAAETGRR